MKVKFFSILLALAFATSSFAFKNLNYAALQMTTQQNCLRALNQNPQNYTFTPKEAIEVCTEDSSETIGMARVFGTNISSEFAQNCYESRVELGEHEAGEEHDEGEGRNAILADVQTCECLKKNRVIGFPTLQEAGKKSGSTPPPSFREFEPKVKTIRLAQAQVEGMQQNTLGAKSPEEIRIAAQVGNVSDEKNDRKPGSKENAGHLRQALTATKGLLAQNTVNSRAVGKNQCFSPATNIAFNRLPKENSFYRSFTGLEFREADWDIDVLKKKFDDLDREHRSKPWNERPEEYRIVKARLEFLNRNPNERRLFSAKRSASAKIKPEEEAALLAAKKRQFAILKANFEPKAPCENGRRACLGNFISSGGYDAYLRQSFALLKDGNISRFRGIMATVEQERIRNNAQLLTDTAEPHILEARFTSLHDRTTKKCYGPDALKPENDCLQTFALYCPMVKRTKDLILSCFEVGKPSLELEELAFGEVDLNPETNQSFQRNLRNICALERKNIRGEKTTFTQWKARVCATAGNPLCEERNQDRLMGTFLAEYPYGPELEGETDPKKIQDQLALISMFSSLAQRQENQSVSKEEAQRVMANTVSVNEVRAVAETNFKDYKFDEKGNTIQSPATKQAPVQEAESKVSSTQESQQQKPADSQAAKTVDPNYASTPQAAAQVENKLAPTPALNPGADIYKEQLEKLQAQLEAARGRIRALEGKKDPVTEEGQDTSSTVDGEVQKLADEESELAAQIAELKQKLADMKKKESESSDEEQTKVSSGFGSGRITAPDPQNLAQAFRSPASLPTFPAPVNSAASLFQRERSSGAKASANLVSLSPDKNATSLTLMKADNSGKPQRVFQVKDEAFFLTLAREVVRGPIEIETLKKLFAQNKEEFDLVISTHGSSVKIVNTKGQSFDIEVISDAKGAVAVKPDVSRSKLEDLRRLLSSSI